MRGLLKSVKCPPLSKITGERPVCQYCGEPLKPRTLYVEVLGHIDHAPETDMLVELGQGSHAFPEAKAVIEAGYTPARVYRIEHRTLWDNDLRTRLSFWLGTYDGYLDEEQLDRLEQVREFARLMDLRQQLERQLCFLARHWSGEKTDQCVLGYDFAPHSFSFCRYLLPA